jgi:hypothetical protein
MSTIPYNYKQYIDDVTKMRQRGHISSGEQINSPSSAGSRGLAKVDGFTKSPNQLMKMNDKTEEDFELARIKQLAGLLK